MGTYAPTNTLGLTMYQCKFLAACTQMRGSHGTLHTPWGGNSWHGRSVKKFYCSTILENIRQICSCKCQLRRRKFCQASKNWKEEDKGFENWFDSVWFCHTLSCLILCISVKVQTIKSTSGCSHKSTVWSFQAIQNARWNLDWEYFLSELVLQTQLPTHGSTMTRNLPRSVWPTMAHLSNH